MKKISTIVLFTFICFQSLGQLIQASIGYGTQPNRIKIYLKTNITVAATLSTLQFNVGVSDVVTTPPTLTIISTSIAGAVWSQNPTASEGGYYNYNIFAANSPLSQNFTAGVEVEVLELEFNNGVPTLGTVGLVTLADGGTSNSGLNVFYCTGSVNSDGVSNLYYPRVNVTLDNQISYNQPTFTPAGTATSTAIITSVTLPVKFTNFTATKKDNGAQLNWQVENETSLTAGYDVERSLNGVEFKKVSSVIPQNNGAAANSYVLTDDLSSVHAGVVYYRIKQTDKDGRFIYSDTRSVRLDGKAFGAAVYPNPVKGKATLSLDLIEDATVAITLNDANGRQVQTIQIKGLKGRNTKEINMSSLPTGNYVLRVLTGTETKSIPVIKGN
jgi:Secretion system C-terminal sorting domain